MRWLQLLAVVVCRCHTLLHRTFSGADITTTTWSFFFLFSFDFVRNSSTLGGRDLLYNSSPSHLQLTDWNSRRENDERERLSSYVVFEVSFIFIRKVGVAYDIAMEFSYPRRLFRPRRCWTASAHWSRSSKNIDFLIIMDNDSSAVMWGKWPERELNVNKSSKLWSTWPGDILFEKNKSMDWVQTTIKCRGNPLSALANSRVIVASAVDTQNRHFNSITPLRSCDKYFKISILIISTHNHHVGARTFNLGCWLLSVCRNSKCLCKLINFHFDSIHYLAYVILWYCVH